MTMNSAIGAVGLVVTALSIWQSAYAETSPPAMTCRELGRADFSATQDAPTQIVEAREVSAAADGPAHCLVQGYVAPQVGIALTLPTSVWNGKLLEIGQGSLGGQLPAERCNDSLRRGYACVTSDTGHRGSGAIWALNNLQAEVDYAFRAPYVAALAAKAIARRYYGKDPVRSYFMGCSGGGRQAMMMAQRFPWTFDGIVAVDPSINLAKSFIKLAWDLQASGQFGTPRFSTADVDVLRRGVLQQCDALDGLKDGIIGNPLRCKFEPAQLSCKAGQVAGCLSAIQVDAAKAIYGGPVTSRGEPIHFPFMPGAEQVGSSPFPDAKSHVYRREQAIGFINDVFRYVMFSPDPGASWTAERLDFDTDFKRTGVLDVLTAADHPDLRKFKAAGAKLIVSQGWNDSGSALPLLSIDYYRNVEKLMGGREQTQDFYRLFMMPGRAHCGGGDGANAVDYLTYLEAWVEQNSAPDVMIAARVDAEYSAIANYMAWMTLPKDPSSLQLTRPIYPYPLEARYKGKGDPNSYLSFEPVEP